MDGACVELHGLARAVHLNAVRGKVTGESEGRYNVLLDRSGETVRVKHKNLCVVFCLGLPRESIVHVQEDDDVQRALDAARAATNDDRFLVFHAARGAGGHIFLRLRREMIAMASERMRACKREPLLRIYAVDHSQADPGVKILFSDAMERGVSDESGNPIVVDLWSDEVAQLEGDVEMPDWERRRIASRVDDEVFRRVGPSRE